MKIGIVIYSEDTEVVFNAFRFGNFSLQKGDSVNAFLPAKGVECESLSTDKFNISEQMHAFIDASGEIKACGTCLKLRDQEESDICPLSTMQDLYDIVAESDKVISF